MKPATPNVTREFTLDNGLRIIVREDHRTPAICASLFHKVGTRNDPQGKRGLAYITGGAASQDKARIEAIEGMANGWLDYDVSTYSLEAPRTALSPVLELLAARMAAPVLSQERLNNGIRRTQELELAEPFFTSDLWITPAFEELIFPHAGPVYKFGNVDQLTVADVLRFHEEGYAPNNSILVVTGDATLEDVQPVVQAFFGDLPRVNDISPVETTSPQTHPRERTITQYLDTEFPRLQMVFNTPSLTTATDPRDIPALHVISALLTSGPQAWIPTRLPDGEKNLSSIISRLPAYRHGDDLLLIATTVSENSSMPLQHIQKDIEQVLDVLKTDLLDDATLEYGRNHAIGKLQDLDTLEIQASIIGNLAAIGLPWKLLDTEEQDLQSVTAEDVQRVASMFLTPERLSVAYILPQQA